MSNVQEDKSVYTGPPHRAIIAIIQQLCYTDHEGRRYYRTTCSGQLRRLRTPQDYEALNYAIGTYKDQIAIIDACDKRNGSGLPATRHS